MDEDEIHQAGNPYNQTKSAKNRKNKESTFLGILPTYFPVRKKSGKVAKEIEATPDTEAKQATEPTGTTKEDTQGTLNDEDENVHYGDEITIKETNTSRMFFLNINSLNGAKKNMEKWRNTTRVLQEQKCDIFGLAEPGIDWKRKDVRRTINTIARHQFGQVALSTARNKNKAKGIYQAGGTLQMATGHWKGRLEQ